MKYTTKQIGDIGEKIAKEYLEKKGWKILCENFAASGGEIDLIGFKNGNLVFFEVKSRSNLNFGTPLDAVDCQKVNRISKASYTFLKLYSKGNKIPIFYPFCIEIQRKIKNKRIDVIEIYLTPDKRAEKINHIENWGELL